VQTNFDATQCAELILTLHATTKDNIERMNVKYKVAKDRGQKHVVYGKVIEKINDGPFKVMVLLR
jgi:hypothetical protein